MFVIEKNVPIPAVERPAKNATYVRYPLGNLNVGDSFMVPTDDRPLAKIQTLLMTQTRHYKPAQFTSRRTDGGVRIWRVS